MATTDQKCLLSFLNSCTAVNIFLFSTIDKSSTPNSISLRLNAAILEVAVLNICLVRMYNPHSREKCLLDSIFPQRQSGESNNHFLGPFENLIFSNTLPNDLRWYYISTKWKDSEENETVVHEASFKYFILYWYWTIKEFQYLFSSI